MRWIQLEDRIAVVKDDDKVTEFRSEYWVSDDLAFMKRTIVEPDRQYEGYWFARITEFNGTMRRTIWHRCLEDAVADDTFTTPIARKLAQQIIDVHIEVSLGLRIVNDAG